MAIISVCEDVGSRRATREFDGSLKTSYTRVFRVVANATVTDLNTLIFLAGNPVPGPDIIPQIGDQYPSDNSALCLSIDPQEEDGHYNFLVQCNYTQPPDEGVEDDPTNLDWEFSSESIEFEEIIERDLDTNAIIANTAGEPFNPPLMEPDYRLVINLSKWFSTWDVADQIARQGKINSAAITVVGFAFSPHTLRCVRWTTSGKQELSSGTYYKLEAQFVHKADYTVKFDKDKVDIVVPGWDRAVIDQGFNEIRDGVRVAILDGKNKAVTVPRLLNGAGAARADSDYGFPVFLPFVTVEEADMTTWGLPIVVP